MNPYQKRSLSLVVILGVFLVSEHAHSQLICTGTGQTVICTNPGGPPTIQQGFNSNTGVLIHPNGQVTPYSLLTPPAPPATPPVPAAPEAPIAPIIVMPSPLGN